MARPLLCLIRLGASVLNRRQFEQSEQWTAVKTAVQERLVQLQSQLMSEDSIILIHRAQGAIQALTDLILDLPKTFVEEDVARAVREGGARAPWRLGEK